MVVLLNYARPQNMPALIKAWKEQSNPPRRVVVVDNSPKNTTSWRTPFDIQPDDVWKVGQNHGCPIRWAPALFYLDVRYVLFPDDDFIPGNKALEHLLDTAALLKGEFAVLGESGRTMSLEAPPGRRYKYGDSTRSMVAPVPCHTTVRCYLTRCQDLVDALVFRTRLLNLVCKPDDLFLLGIHDDLIANVGIQHLTRWHSYMVPISDDPEKKVIKVEIPTGQESLHRRNPNHLRDRNRMVDLCLEAGWEGAL
jgi:hypothetical protein